MRYIRLTILFLFPVLFLANCSDPCDAPKAEIKLDLDYYAAIRNLAAKDCDPEVFAPIHPSVGLSLDIQEDLVFELTKYYEEEGNADALFACFPDHAPGDFQGLNDYLFEEVRFFFDVSYNILRSRFESFEESCVEPSMLPGRGGYSFQFLDTLQPVADQLVEIPGKFDILETMRYKDCGEALAMADSVLVGMSDSGAAVSFTGLFNREVMPNPNSPVIGESTVGDSAQINQVLSHPEMKGYLDQSGIEMLWTKADARIGGDKADAGLQLIAVKQRRSGDPIGTRILEAFVGGDDLKPAVRVGLNAAGAKELRELSERNQGRSLAMVLDGVIWQMAKVGQPLIDGRFELTGGLSKQQSQILAAVLLSGALEVPLLRLE